jgi:hypothetical protein
MRKAFSGSAFLMACGLAAPFFIAAPAMAEIDKAALTQCLVDNTTDDHIAAMKRLMIAALQDDIETMKTEVQNYGNIIVQMAISKCNIQASDLQDPAVSEAVGAYGQKLGEKIMTEAFAKIGQ